MSRLLTLLLILAAGLPLLGAGCQKEEQEPKQEQFQEQVESPEEQENLAITAKEEHEQTRARNKDCQKNSWSTMSEGPYNDKISFATSTDLLSWTDSQKTLAEHSSVPGAIYKDSTIYVYFVDVAEDCYSEKLSLIKSTDQGASWTAKETVYIKGLGDKVAVDPAPFLMDDGRVRLYYFDIEGSKNPAEDFKIYSAISTDGINFAEEGVCFSNPGTLDPDVIKVDDTWRLYTGDIENNATISATSSDGLNFTKEGTAYSGGSVPDVFYKDNTYFLYTVGINIATSEDGKSFTDTGKSFRSQLGMVTADPSVIELNDGSYMMLYKYGEPGGSEPDGSEPGESRPLPEPDGM